MENAIPENELYDGEEATDLIYALAAAPGFVPGSAGVAFAASPSGLQRSADGGQTWQDALVSLELTDVVPVTSLVLAPNFAEDRRVLAGAPGGIFISTDAGESFKALLFPSPPPTVSTLAISPNFAADGTIFAGTMEDGVFISRNGGESWVSWNFGLLDLNIIGLAISPDFANDETIFAGTETGIFRSTNSARAWREIELPFGFEAVLSLAFSAEYASDHTLYAGSENHGLWVSRDEGEHWSRLAEDAISDPVNSILVSGAGLLAVTGAALYHSADGGQTWTDRMPEGYAGREISALLPLQGSPKYLAGFTDGEVEAITLG